MKKTLKYVAILALFGVVLVGCKSFTKGYSNSPYGATSAPAPQLFAGSQGAFDQFMEGFPSQISALWAQAATGSSRQFQGYYSYQTSAQDYANDWATAYTNVLYNLRLTEQEAAANGQKNLEGAAKIMEGIQVGTITALWGNVPYSQAAEPAVTTTPKFDAQATVYTEVQATLDAGIALLNSNNAKLQADIFSSAGSPAIWLAAAYTAKARYEMQAARADGYTTAELTNVINWAKQGIIATDGSQDMMFLHTGGVYNGDMNLWYSFGVYDRSGYIDASKSFAIPMLEAYGLGNQMNYYFDTTASPVDLNYNTGAFTATTPFPIFRASEGNLLIAEAYARENDLANALTYLNDAITYNNNTYGDSMAAYAAADPAVATQGAMLQTIFNEEYLSLFPQVELFNFVRRVDYQIIYKSGTSTVKLTPVNGAQFPQRFFYPTNEITANPNTPVQSSSDLYAKTPVNSVADPKLSQ
jgi:starch-binding outer membrane protein, SusD/RagB family